MDGGSAAGSEDLAQRYFDAADLDALEQEFRNRIGRDPRDMRAAFKLGMSSAARNDLDRASQYFSNVAASGWNSGLAQNNLAVAYFRSGMTGSAIEMLLRVAEIKDCPPAALFNLGIICDRLNEFGGDVPTELVECGLLPRDKSPDERAVEYFRRALQAPAPWSAGLDGGLYLWPEDVPPSVGFPVNLAQPRVDDAHRHLFEGIACAGRQEWQAAIEHFDLAAAAYPPIGKASSDVRVVALLGLCRKLRGEIAHEMEGADYAGAEARIVQLASVCAEVAVDDLLRELLVDELNAIGSQLEHSEPIADFSVLQAFSKAIKDAVVRLASTTVEADRVDPGAVRAPEGSMPIFAARCAKAVEDLLRRLLQKRRHEASVELLAWAEQQWFASSLQPFWRREINHAKALDHWSSAKDAIARQQRTEAKRLLGTALLAAQEAEAPGLVETIEHELACLHGTATDPDAIREVAQAIAERRYADAARLCAKALQSNANDETLLAQLATALQRLRSDGHALARTANWDEAITAIDAYLEHRPEDKAAQSLRVNLGGKRSDAAIERAWNKWNARESAQSPEAHQDLVDLCNRILALHPGHARALELLEEMVAVERRASASAAGANQFYSKELVALEEAIGKNDAASAFAHALKLREFRREDPHTQEACARAFALFVSALQTRMEADGTDAALADVERDLLKLLNVESKHRPALDLLEALQRRRVARAALF